MFNLRTWYQDLAEGKGFHFRGSLGTEEPYTDYLKYEFIIKRSFSFNINVSKGTQFTIGFLFFTLYFTFCRINLPLFKRGRDYGFYLYDWCFVMRFANNSMDISSSDPWYNYFSLDIKAFFLGRMIHYSKPFSFVSRGKDEQPIYFMFRDKTYKLDKIELSSDFWFRSRIPFGLMHRKNLSVSLTVDNPPMHRGKGTTSYNCDDDGTYGIGREYTGPEIKHSNKDIIYCWCAEMYCDHALKDIQRYGRVESDRVLNQTETNFKYLGINMIPKI